MDGSLHSNPLADIFTVLNMHELATTNGFAAAYRLGADSPHLDDEECMRLFQIYQEGGADLIIIIIIGCWFATPNCSAREKGSMVDT